MVCTLAYLHCFATKLRFAALFSSAVPPHSLAGRRPLSWCFYFHQHLPFFFWSTFIILPVILSSFFLFVGFTPSFVQLLSTFVWVSFVVARSLSIILFILVFFLLCTMPIEFIHYYFDFHVFRSFLGLLFVYSHRPYIEQTRVAFFCDDSNRIEHKKKFAHSKNERCFVRTYTHTCAKFLLIFWASKRVWKKPGWWWKKTHAERLHIFGRLSRVKCGRCWCCYRFYVIQHFELCVIIVLHRASSLLDTSKSIASHLFYIYKSQCGR